MTFAAPEGTPPRRFNYLKKSAQLFMVEKRTIQRSCPFQQSQSFVKAIRRKRYAMEWTVFVTGGGTTIIA
jgi:hypothetical protein